MPIEPRIYHHVLLRLLAVAAMCASCCAPAARAQDAAIAEVTMHPGSGVFAAQLDNGVRLLHRRVESDPPRVILRVALLGGEIHETGLDRGITRGAFEPAWQGHESLPEGITHRVEVSPDAPMLVLESTPDRFDELARLASEFVRSPALADDAFERWREDARERFAESLRNPMRVALTALCLSELPSDQARFRPIEPGDLDRLTPDAVRAHMAGMCVQAPVQVTVVGDIEAFDAAAAVSEHFGRLTSRSRPGSTVLDTPVCNERGGDQIERTIETDSERAAVVVSMNGPDIERIGELRTVIVASRLLAARLNPRDGTEHTEHDPWVYIEPGELFRNTGMLIIGASPIPGEADQMARTLDSALAELGEHGPDDDELRAVRAEIDAHIARLLGDPAFWSRRLGELERHGRSFDDLVELRRAYRTIDADEVRAVVEQYRAGGVRRVIVRPTGTDQPTP